MEDFEWNVVNEGYLLDAMVGHKPVGINKYFQMAFICEKFIENSNKDIESDKIWTHLETMYNLEALDESEGIPFPNSEREFHLPESDFGNLINKKEEEKNKTQAQKGGRETPKLIKEVKKDEKIPNKNTKERRDSKEGKDLKVVPTAKKEMKKESEKPKPPVKGRGSTTGGKETKTKVDEKAVKRPTRGSLKPNDDSGSSGKSSPVNVTPTGAKRRRI